MRSIVAFLLLASLAACSDSRCTDTPMRSESDLAGPLAAFEFARDCHADKEPTVNVAVGERAVGQAGAHVVFTGDSEGRADKEKGNLRLEMHWTEPHRLSIAYAEGAHISRAESRAGLAQIVYRGTSWSVFVPAVPMRDWFGPPPGTAPPRPPRPRRVRVPVIPPIDPAALVVSPAPMPSADTAAPAPHGE